MKTFLEYQNECNAPVQRYELTEDNMRRYGYSNMQHYKSSSLKHWIGINKRIVNE